jgi:hypothetical protein
VEAAEGLKSLLRSRQPFLALPAAVGGLKGASAFEVCVVMCAHWKHFPGYHRLSLIDYHLVLRETSAMIVMTRQAAPVVELTTPEAR